MLVLFFVLFVFFFVFSNPHACANWTVNARKLLSVCSLSFVHVHVACLSGLDQKREERIHISGRYRSKGTTINDLAGGAEEIF